MNFGRRTTGGFAAKYGRCKTRRVLYQEILMTSEIHTPARTAVNQPYDRFADGTAYTVIAFDFLLPTNYGGLLLLLHGKTPPNRKTIGINSPTLSSPRRPRFRTVVGLARKIFVSFFGLFLNPFPSLSFNLPLNLHPRIHHTIHDFNQIIFERL